MLVKARESGFGGLGKFGLCLLCIGIINHEKVRK